MPEIIAGAQAGFFLQGHLGNQGFDIHSLSLLYLFN
jgi:hypothetical protein